MLKRWITYYLFLLASLVFALMYPGRVSSAFFYALLLLPLASLLLSSLLLIGFSYRQDIDRLTVTKGEEVTFLLTLRNKSPLLLPFVEVSFYGAGSFFEKDFGVKRLSAPAFRKTALPVKLSCRYKGVYEIGVRQIKINDFFGLFSFRQSEALFCTLTVFPRIVPIGRFPAVAGLSGDFPAPAARSHDITENVSDIRKYQSGDRMRAVHWKLSAKKEELMVKNFEQSSGFRADLILDASGISADSAESIPEEDRFVECAVSVAYHFAASSIPATLYFHGDKLVKQQINDIADFSLAYRMLSEATFSRESGAIDISALVRDEGADRKAVVVLAASLTPALASQSLRLRTSGYNVIVVHIPPAREEKAADEELTKTRAALLDAGVSLHTVGANEDIGAALARRAAV